MPHHHRSWSLHFSFCILHFAFFLLHFAFCILQDCTVWRLGTWELFALSGFEIPGATKMNGKVNSINSIPPLLIKLASYNTFIYLVQELGVMEIQNGNPWITTQKRRWACTICMLILQQQIILVILDFRYDGEFWMEFFHDFCREFEVLTLNSTFNVFLFFLLNFLVCQHCHRRMYYSCNTFSCTVIKSCIKMWKF